MQHCYYCSVILTRLQHLSCNVFSLAERGEDKMFACVAACPGFGPDNTSYLWKCHRAARLKALQLLCDGAVYIGHSGAGGEGLQLYCVWLRVGRNRTGTARRQSTRYNQLHNNHTRAVVTMETQPGCWKDMSEALSEQHSWSFFFYPLPPTSVRQREAGVNGGFPWRSSHHSEDTVEQLSGNLGERDVQTLPNFQQQQKMFVVMIAWCCQWCSTAIRFEMQSLRAPLWSRKGPAAKSLGQYDLHDYMSAKHAT